MTNSLAAEFRPRLAALLAKSRFREGKASAEGSDVTGMMEMHKPGPSRGTAIANFL